MLRNCQLFLQCKLPNICVQISNEYRDSWNVVYLKNPITIEEIINAIELTPNRDIYCEITLYTKKFHIYNIFDMVPDYDKFVDHVISIINIEKTKTIILYSNNPNILHVSAIWK